MADAALAMQTAQQAANSEGKSSAGDKYETARAMAQADRDRAARQWAEANALLAQLARAKTAPITKQAQLGSIVVTETALYFLGVGLGKVGGGPPPIYALSAQAPAGKALWGLKAGQVANLPAGACTITEIR